MQSPPNPSTTSCANTCASGQTSASLMRRLIPFLNRSILSIPRHEEHRDDGLCFSCCSEERWPAASCTLTTRSEAASMDEKPDPNCVINPTPPGVSPEAQELNRDWEFLLNGSLLFGKAGLTLSL